MEEEPNKQELVLDHENRAKATIKQILLLLALLVLIVVSFWFSFQLGKKILMPAKDSGERIKVEIPNVPADIAGLQDVADIDEKAGGTVAKAASCGPSKTAGPGFYKVQAGFFKDLRNANLRKSVLRDKGFEVFVKKVTGGYRVQLGAFKSKSSATALRNKVTARGIQAVVIFE